jgi:ABC-2 type transport system permease protein
MSGLATLLRKELLEQWRTARLPIVATVFLLVGLSSPLLARFTPDILKAVGGDQFGALSIPTPTSADAYAQLAKNLGQFGALVAVLLAMGSVATEKERGTAALILTKPASRDAFLLAKMVAIATTLGISTAIAGAGAWLYTLVLFEPLPVGGFVASMILQWLALVSAPLLVAIVSVAFVEGMWVEELGLHAGHLSAGLVHPGAAANVRV